MGRSTGKKEKEKRFMKLEAMPFFSVRNSVSIDVSLPLDSANHFSRYPSYRAAVCAQKKIWIVLGS